MTTPCTHLDQIRDVTPSAEGCEECLQIGDTWVPSQRVHELRPRGLLDSSKNKHVTKRFHTTGHPIVQSFEPRENWSWCHVDQVFL